MTLHEVIEDVSACMWHQQIQQWRRARNLPVIHPFSPPRTMEDLPIDVLPIVFSYLDASTCIRVRLVCHKWRLSSGRGCLFLRVGHLQSSEWRHDLRVGSIILKGSIHQDCIIDNAGSNRLKRTRGHLPEPNVFPEGLEVSSLTVLSGIARFDNRFHQVLSDGVATKWRGFAAKIEREGQTPFVALDLEASKIEVAHRAMAGHSGPLFDGITGKPRSLKRALEFLNVCGLSQLKRLSVRGCSSLEALYLPPSLVAVDASGCTNLRRLSMPEGVSESGLVALNLNGCRSLETQGELLFGPGTEQALVNAREIDLSGVNLIVAPAIARALRVTTCLDTLSIRYVATDDVLFALSESVSARETLRFIDVAFSTELTDTSVEVLIQSASKLERLNLRGCKKVSVECYNKVPVLLMNRQSGVSGCDSGRLQSNPGRKARKGDNVFSFVAATSRKSVKRAKRM